MISALDDLNHVGCIWHAALPHMGMSSVNLHLEFFSIHGGIASIPLTSKFRHTQNTEETAMYKKSQPSVIFLSSAQFNWDCESIWHYLSYCLSLLLPPSA